MSIGMDGPVGMDGPDSFTFQLQDKVSRLLIFASVFKDFKITDYNSVIVVANYNMVERVYREFKEFLVDQIQPIFRTQTLITETEMVNLLLISRHNHREYEWGQTHAHLYITTPVRWWNDTRGRSISQVYYHPQDLLSRDFCFSREVLQPEKKKKPRRMIQI